MSSKRAGRLSRTGVIVLGTLLSGCAHLVKISYGPAAVIHPAFDQRTIDWEGERVQIVLTSSLQGETLKYLMNNEKVFLATRCGNGAFATYTR